MGKLTDRQMWLFVMVAVLILLSFTACTSQMLRMSADECVNVVTVSSRQESCPWGIPMKDHKAGDCFSSSKNVLESLCLRNEAIYGLRCGLAYFKNINGENVLRGRFCSMVPYDIAPKEPMFIIFRRFPQFVEFYKVEASLFGEWRVTNDTVHIDYKFIVVDGLMRSIRPEELDQYEKNYVLEGDFLRLPKEKMNIVALWNDIKKTHHELTEQDSLVFFRTAVEWDSLIGVQTDYCAIVKLYGDDNWWKKQ